MQAENTHLRSQEHNLQDDLRAIYKKHRAQLQELEAQYRHTEYEARYSELVAENAALATRVSALTEAAAVFRRASHRYEALEATTADAMRMLQAHSEALPRLQRRWEASEAAVLVLEERLAEAHQAGEDAQASASTSARRAAAAEDAQSLLMLEKDELALQLHALQTDYAQLQGAVQALEALQASNAELLQRCTELEREKAQAQAATEERCRDMNVLQQELDQSEQATSQATASLLEELAACQDEIATLKQQLVEVHHQRQEAEEVGFGPLRKGWVLLEGRSSGG
jgi:chromosome segregation ATPase